MTCRDEILEAFRLLETRCGRREFTVGEIVDHMARQGTRYRESTIRTHVTSRLCVDAPDHHAVRYPDLVRVERGRYRLASAG